MLKLTNVASNNFGDQIIEVSTPQGYRTFSFPEGEWVNVQDFLEELEMEYI